MLRKLLTCACALPLLAGACSGGDEEGGAGNGANGDGTGNDDGIFDKGGEVTESGDGGVAFGRGEKCVATSVATESSPLDIYVMFDQSCSMSCPPEQGGAGLCCTGGPRPRMDQVRKAMDDFINNPKSAGIGVGIGYFGYMQAGNTSCDPGDYARPAVGIAPLPGNAGTFLGSLHSVTPTGETPTGAALRGACSYASGWKRANPGHQTVILLVTDGFPEAPVTGGRCQPSVPDTVAAARECLSADPHVPTYLLGVGQNLGNLNQIAQAGGTGQAYFISPGATEVSGEVLEALNSIRDTANVPCNFKVPPAPAGETLNPSLVNVTLYDARGDTRLIGSAGNAAGCGADGGWYYEDPTNPVSLQLCPATCDHVTAALVAGSVFGRPARLDIQYGCETVETTR